MVNETARKWSVEEFYRLVRHDLTNGKGPVELIEGHIVPLIVSELLDRQIERLRQQIQQVLAPEGFKGFEVRSHYPIQITPYSELRPTLTVLSMNQPQPTIHWVIDIDKAELSHDQAQASAQQGPPDGRSHLYAHHGIEEYWALSTEQVELRTYHTPNSTIPLVANEQSDSELSAQYRAQYQHHQLQHVDAQVNPVAFPQLTLTVQEPLPLYFLTRTATGHQTYLETQLPIKIRR